MRILVFTTLFPSSEMPSHGVFVENRLRAYVKKYDADVKVIAPVPWFPFQSETFGKYAAFARAPKKETRNSLEIRHPRYFLAPKIGMAAAPASLQRCLVAAGNQLRAEGWDFDLIDAHYFYPDGVAAVAAARQLDRPVVVTARGSDITELPKFNGPREKIVSASFAADHIISVSAALRKDLTQLGAPGDKITVLRNGVDLTKFAPGNRSEIRQKMNLSGPVIASVGHLIDRKGHDIVIDAVAKLPDATLLIVGDGERRAALKARAHRLGVEERIRFLGSLPPDDLPEIYNAADVLALASSREGWPNVLLEAMACGTPCVASNVGGSKEAIRDPAAGRLVEKRTPNAFVEALQDIFQSGPERRATRRYAEMFSWDQTVDGMHEVFCCLHKKSAARSRQRLSPVVIKSARPKLVVTIDAEESFDWSQFERNAWSVQDPEDMEPFQRLCEDAGAKPLYFLTYPVLKDPAGADFYRELYLGGSADCGLHLHAWATPPESDHSGSYYSFQKNLPPAIYRQKLEALAGVFEDVFFARASAHRAGRYGISWQDYSLLREIGVRFDFSPCAGFDFSDAGGPDFKTLSNRPFRAQSGGEFVTVTPVSGARAINHTDYFLSQETVGSGIIESLARPVRLSPEGTSLKDLKALTRRLVADRTPVLTFTLHSTSLSVGANPYAKSSDDVARMLHTTRAYLDWFSRSLGGEMISVDELAALYENSGRSAKT